MLFRRRNRLKEKAREREGEKASEGSKTQVPLSCFPAFPLSNLKETRLQLTERRETSENRTNKTQIIYHPNSVIITNAQVLRDMQ